MLSLLVVGAPNYETDLRGALWGRDEDVLLQRRREPRQATSAASPLVPAVAMQSQMEPAEPHASRVQ